MCGYGFACEHISRYKWSHEYSRSIGVDVRYILWLVGVYDGAQHLVQEMTAQKKEA